MNQEIVSIKTTTHTAVGKRSARFWVIECLSNCHGNNEVYFVNWMYAHQSHHNRCSNTIVYVSNTIVYVSNTIVYVVNLSNW